MTKAWKILKLLRGIYRQHDDSDISLWLQLCDDAQWEKLAKEAGLKPTEGYGKALEKGGTSCYVSRDVKAIVFTQLRSTGNSRPVARGQDALNRAVTPIRK